jgi:hypothetical protein
MNTYIQNYGFTKTYSNTNGKKAETELKWLGDYDGEKANIRFDINDNGEKEAMNLELDNNDIMGLLSTHSVERPIDERLIDDFLMFDNGVIDVLPPPPLHFLGKERVPLLYTEHKGIKKTRKHSFRHKKSSKHRKQKKHKTRSKPSNKYGFNSIF